MFFVLRMGIVYTKHRVLLGWLNIYRMKNQTYHEQSSSGRDIATERGVVGRGRAGRGGAQRGGAGRGEAGCGGTEAEAARCAHRKNRPL